MSESPKTFISYSWTSPEHEEWVLQLATQLVENGADVILDKWHLREGADKYVFMEKMVTDPELKKVIMICDKAYAEKADKRKGGVGTETQVISGEIYAKVEDNKKFVPIIREKDESGQAYLPKYLMSRIFIDMSDHETETKNFEQLLRWVFDKPIYQRPELGRPPSFIFEESAFSFGTSSKHRLALDSLKNNKPSVIGSVRDYFETFADNLSQLKIEPKEEANLDDQVLESIESFTHFRDEITELFLAIVKYDARVETYREIHRFFESLLPYTSTKPDHERSWIEGEQDNLIFIVQEIFLYGIAVLLKYEKFEEIGELLSQRLYNQKFARLNGFQSDNFDYTIFSNSLTSLDKRKSRLHDNSISLLSNLFRDRANRRDVTFQNVQQADFVLYLYSVLHLGGSFEEFSWFPHTLLFVRHSSHPFEMFSRAQSQKYFDRIKPCLDLDDKVKLVELSEKCKTERGYSPSWNYGQRKVNVPYFMNIDKLATLP